MSTYYYQDLTKEIFLKKKKVDQTDFELILLLQLITMDNLTKAILITCNFTFVPEVLGLERQRRFTALR